MVKDIIVMGDVHGEFGYVNTLINRKKPKIILQCGDFGIWQKAMFEKNADGWLHENLKLKNTKLYFCAGNHENWDHLDTLLGEDKTREPIEIMENLFFCPFGSTLTLPDGRNVLFAGGAESIDRDFRTPHVDWFIQEIIDDHDMSFLDNVQKADIVVAHTCPSFVMHCIIQENSMKQFLTDKFADPSCRMLSEVFDKYNPNDFYFGHFHTYDEFVINSTRFTALSCPKYTSKRWWKYLN